MPKAAQTTSDFKGDHLNVTMFGAEMDGVTDDTAAFVAAWAALPIRGGTLHIPPGTMKVTGPLALPPKSVILRGDGCVLPTNWANVSGGPSPVPISGSNGGSILWNAGAGQLFSPGTFVDCQLSIRDLVLFGGSGVVKIGNSNTTINLHVSDVAALWMTGTAFEIGADDVTGNTFFSRFERLLLFNCGIGILSHINSDLTVEDCYCLQNSVHSLEIRGANARIARNTFIGGAGSAGTSDCDILLFPPANSLATGALYNIGINRNKFGNELSVPGETRVKINFGNAAVALAHPDYWVGGADVSHNHFIGTFPTPGHPTACVKLYSPCWNNRFADNDFQTATYAIDDSVVPAENISTGNSYRGNKHWFGTVPFKNGGVSFAEISGLEYGPFAPATPHATDWMNIQNLLTVSEDFTGWSSSNMAFTPGQADPLGGTGAFTATKTAANAALNQGFTTTATGPVVFSIWLKAGSTQLATISINNALSTTVFAQKFIGLDSQWRRYSIRLANVASGTNLAVSVLPDISGATALDSIVAFGGQVNSGEEANGYYKTAGSPFTGTYGIRSPQDISAFQDILAGRDVAAVRNLVGVDALLSDGGKVTNPFAFWDWIQALAGVAYRFSLANDNTFRLQRYSSYPGVLADTPFQVDSSGHIFISNTGANGNVVVRESAFGNFDVPQFDIATGLFSNSSLSASLPVKTAASKQLITGAIDLSGSEVTGTLAHSHLDGATFTLKEATGIGTTVLTYVISASLINSFTAGESLSVTTNSTTVAVGLTLVNHTIDHGLVMT